MEFLSNGWNVLLILAGFGVLIFVHEMGHFLAARWAGIRCESFSIGMGPPLVAWRRGIGWRAGSTDPATIARFGRPAVEMDDEELARNGLGETEWSLRALPLGGFVRMLGQDDLDPARTSSARRSYQRAPVGKRMVVVTAGVACNLVLAVAMFVVAFLAGVRFEAPVVGAVVPGSPAAEAAPEGGGDPGLRPGDRVVAIDGSGVQTFADIQIASAMARPGHSLAMEVLRNEAGAGSRPLRFAVTPRKDPASGLLAIGIGPAVSGTVGEVREGERDIFDRSLRAAGLMPTDEPGGDDPIAALLAVEDGPGGPMVPVLRQDEAPGAGEADSGMDAPLPEQALAAAASRSRGKPFRTTWLCRSGRQVERTLEPAPRFQELFVAARAGADAEAERGLVGLVPLLEVRAVPPGSPNEGTLRPGDVILRAEQAEGPRLPALREALAPRAGGSAGLTVLRDGKAERITVAVDRKGRMGALMAPALGTPLVAGALARAAVDGGAERDMPGAALGLPPRTRIDAVAGRAVTDWSSLRAALLASTGAAASAGTGAEPEVTFTWPTPGQERGTARLALSAEDVRSLHSLGWTSPVPQAIFEPLMTTLTAHGNPFTAAAMGFRQTRTLVTMTYLTLDRIARGSVGVEQLRGPVGIVDLGARVVDRGAMYLVFFLAMISVNLAVLNFLPLPIVDGGLFLYLVYERVTGHPPSVRFQNAATTLGLVLLGGIFLLTFYNDVMRIIGGS